jgi:hypothetical protein
MGSNFAIRGQAYMSRQHLGPGLQIDVTGEFG